MKIVAHRGYWLKESEKNTVMSITKAIRMGISIETDIRDFNGEIYISHDPIKNPESLISLKELLEIHEKYNSKSLLFLNIKSDGLYNLIYNNDYVIKNFCYFFDMSFPELVQYSKRGYNFLTRISDLETLSNTQPLSKGKWIDSFYDFKWFFNSNILIEKNQINVFVSPELHKHDHLEFWNYLSQLNIDFYLCTDLIEEASDFFNVQKN